MSANLSAHIKAIVLLPGMVLIVIPYTLNKLASHELIDVSKFNLHPLLNIIGILIGIIGLMLLVLSVRLFIQIGKGTLAPWDPTKKLVIVGLYRYMRNPMITGVLCILLSLSLLSNSLAILLWMLLFFAINTIYFVVKEEPDLEKRFGKSYTDYKSSVPRWFPRIRF